MCRVVALQFVSEQWPAVRFEMSRHSLDCDDITQNIEVGEFSTIDCDQTFAGKLITLLTLEAQM